MKQCSKCKDIKPASAFCRHKKSKDGLQSYCKDCNNQINKLAYHNKKNTKKGIITLTDTKEDKNYTHETYVASVRFTETHKRQGDIYVRGKDLEHAKEMLMEQVKARSDVSDFEVIEIIPVSAIKPPQMPEPAGEDIEVEDAEKVTVH